jgi:pilus assembly protein FimV
MTLYGMDRTAMFRTASILLLLASTFPTWVGALALGEIELRSKLSQELDARIPLAGVDAADLEGMNVTLANAANFERAGVDRSFILTTLRFRVVDAESGAYIAVSSRGPVSEPFLNFLMEVDWPAGHLIREFTMLLDPPVYGAALQTVSQEVATPARDTRSTSQQGPAATASTGRLEARNFGAAGSYGPVQRSDTLWSIALRARPDNSVTVQQTMLAILRANPGAFINGNVNSLRAGSILELPNRGEIAVLDAGGAVAQVRQQNATWSESRRTLGRTAATRPSTVATRPSTAATGGDSASTSGGANSATTGATTNPSTPSIAASGEVIISGGSSKGEATGGDATGSLASMETRLDSALEALGQLQSQVDDLNSKLGEADSLITGMDRMLELRDTELSSLQAKLAGAEQALSNAASTPDTGATDAITTAPSSDSTDTSTAGGINATGGATAGTESTDAGTDPIKAPADATDGSAAQPAPPPPLVLAPPKATAWYEDILELVETYVPVDPVVGGGLLAGILTILGLGAVLKRRGGQKNKKADPASPGLEEVMQNPEVYEDQTTASAGSEDATAMASTVVAETVPEEAFDDSDTGATMRADQLGEEDPLQEVNVYLAYEQFEQAEQVVRGAIEQFPDRHAYKLKLMEVQHGARDRTGFMRSMQVLEAAVGPNDALMTRARGLLDSLPDDAPANAADTGVELGDQPASTDTVDAGLDFDLGFDTGPDSATGTAADSVVGSESSVDFDLGLDLDNDTMGTADGGALDFTLDAVDEMPGGGTSSTDAGAELDFTLDAADEMPGGGTSSTNAGAELDFTLDAADETSAPDPLGSGTGIDFDLGADFFAEDEQIANYPGEREVSSLDDESALGPIGAETEVLDFDVAFGTDAAASVAEHAPPGGSDDSLSLDDLDFDLDSLDEGPAISDAGNDVVEARDSLDIGLDIGSLDDDVSAGADASVNFDTVRLDLNDVSDVAPDVAMEPSGGARDSLIDLAGDDAELSTPSFDIEMDDAGLASDGSDEDTLDGLQLDDFPDLLIPDSSTTDDYEDVVHTELMLDVPGSDDDEISLDLGDDLSTDELSDDSLEIDFDFDGLGLDDDADALVGEAPLESSLSADSLSMDDSLDGPLADDDELSIEIDLPDLLGSSADDSTDNVGDSAFDLGDLVDPDAPTVHAPGILDQLRDRAEAGGDGLPQPYSDETLQDIDLDSDFDGLLADELTNPELTLGENADQDIVFEVDESDDGALSLNRGETERTIATTGSGTGAAVEELAAVSEDEQSVVDFDLGDFDAVVSSDSETVVAGPGDFAELETVVGGPSGLPDGDAAHLDIADEETVDVSGLGIGAESSDGAVDFDLDFGDIELEDETTAPTVGLGTIDDAIDDDEIAILGRSLGDDVDEVQTKLDLAEEYAAMGDKDAARDVLEEVQSEGSEQQRQAATAILNTLS